MRLNAVVLVALGGYVYYRFVYRKRRDRKREASEVAEDRVDELRQWEAEGHEVAALAAHRQQEQAKEEKARQTAMNIQAMTLAITNPTK